MITIRRPAVSDLFYPADPQKLRETIKVYLNSAKAVCPVPKAIIVPHAGYIYSGPVAATAYACVAQGRSDIEGLVGS